MVTLLPIPRRFFFYISFVLSLSLSLALYRSLLSFHAYVLHSLENTAIDRSITHLAFYHTSVRAYGSLPLPFIFLFSLLFVAYAYIRYYV